MTCSLASQGRSTDLSPAQSHPRLTPQLHVWLAWGSLTKMPQEWDPSFRIFVSVPEFPDPMPYRTRMFLLTMSPGRPFQGFSPLPGGPVPMMLTCRIGRLQHLPAEGSTFQRATSAIVRSFERKRGQKLNCSSSFPAVLAAGKKPQPWERLHGTVKTRALKPCHGLD